jgi:hypothetical protein
MLPGRWSFGFHLSSTSLPVPVGNDSGLPTETGREILDNACQ